MRQQTSVSNGSALVAADDRPWPTPVVPATWTVVPVEAGAVERAAR